MLIDWFTVGAQVLNFLVLVWLLKRFLYKPILNAIDSREKRIASELADADLKKVDAEKERTEFDGKNKAFDEQRSALFIKATDEAKAERERLFNEVRKNAETLSAQRQESLSSDARNLNQALCLRTQDEVFAIARNALKDLASTSVEECLVQVFTRRLGEMDGDMKKILGEAVTASSDRVIVRSAFDLSPEQHATIQHVLSQTFKVEIRAQFETTPELISGIELISGGQKMGWTIESYLASLKKGVDEIMNKRSKSVAPPPINTVTTPITKIS